MQKNHSLPICGLNLVYLFRFQQVCNCVGWSLCLGESHIFLRPSLRSEIYQRASLEQACFRSRVSMCFSRIFFRSNSEIQVLRKFCVKRFRSSVSVVELLRRTRREHRFLSWQGIWKIVFPRHGFLFLFVAPLRLSVWSRRFSIEPNSCTSLTAVFSPMPGQSGNIVRRVCP